MNKDAKVIPVIDCPICGEKDVALSHKTTMTKGKNAVEIWECSHCGKVPNIDKDVKIKRFLSIKELEAQGYK